MKLGVTTSFTGSLLAFALAIVTAFTVLSSCSRQADAVDVPPAPPTVNDIEGDGQALQAQEQRRVKVEITFTARVKKLLPDDTRGLQHQKFLLILSNGTTVLVAHDTSMAPRVPIEPGDVITIHGEYIWNRKGGLMHWTHRSDTPRHEGGWIDFNGQRYQ